MRTLLAVLLLCTASQAAQFTGSLNPIEYHLDGSSVVNSGFMDYGAGLKTAFSLPAMDIASYDSLNFHKSLGGPVSFDVFVLDNWSDHDLTFLNPPGPPLATYANLTFGNDLGTVALGDGVSDATLNLPADLIQQIQGAGGFAALGVMDPGGTAPATQIGASLTFTTIPQAVGAPLPAAVWGLPALLGVLALWRRRIAHGGGFL